MVKNLKGEVWKPVKGYEGLYEVSNMGRVKSLSYLRTGKERLLSLMMTDNGYVFVGLNKHNEGRHYMVHRIEYEAFHGEIPKFVVTQKGNERMEVNHINEIKSDNRLENLELVTCTQNNNHGTHKQKIAAAISRKVYQYTLDGKLVRTWDSVKSCIAGGFFATPVGLCCRNKYNHPYPNVYKGYIWSYTPLEK